MLLGRENNCRYHGVVSERLSIIEEGCALMQTEGNATLERSLAAMCAGFFWPGWVGMSRPTQASQVFDLSCRIVILQQCEASNTLQHKQRGQYRFQCRTGTREFHNYCAVETSDRKSFSDQKATRIGTS